MNISYKYIMLAAVCLLTACQSNETLDDWKGSSDEAVVKVNATIAGLRTRTNAEGSGDEWTDGDKIRVTNVSSNAIAGKELVTFIYNGTDKTFTQDYVKEYAVWVDGENTFEAYYPSGGRASYNTLALNGYQNDLNNLRQQDWMLATATVAKPEDNCLNLTFEHQLAKVTVKITKYNDQFGDQRPTIDTPYFTNLSADDERIAHPYLSGAYFAEGNNQGVIAYVVVDDKEGKHSFTGILPSGKYKEGVAFMKFGLGTEKVSVPVNSFLTETGLEKGKAYTFNLTVGKNKASISSVEVTDWKTSDLDPGTADETFAIVDVTNHAITLLKEGQLTEAMIKKALDGGNDLKISGKMSHVDSYRDETITYTDDLGILRAYLLKNYDQEGSTPVNLDLSDAQITELPTYALTSSFYNSGIYGYCIGEVQLPKTIEKIEGCFYKQTKCKITNWDELTSLTEIGMQAFGNNINEGDIILPPGLKTLGYSSFIDNEKLTSIVIPAGVTNCSDRTSSTFAFCSALKHITYKGDMKGEFHLTFNGCTALETLDLSACTSVPGLYTGTGTGIENVTVYVKDADMKTAFETDSEWGKARAIEVKTE